MNLHPFKRLFLSLGLLVAGFVHAQPGTPAPSPVISARIKCLAMQGPVNGVEILLGNGKRLPLTAATDYISRSHAYQGPARLTLVRALSSPKPAAAPAENPALAALKAEVLATVELPETGGDFLFLFSGDTATRLHVMAVPFSSTDVPPSNCLVWNVTSRSLGLLLGGQKTVLAAGQRQLLKPVGSVKNYYDLKIFDEYQGRARPLIGGAHFLDETSRQLLFIVEKTPGQSAILIRTIEELPEPPTPQPTATLASHR